jgi:hypothetical protein
VHEEALVKFVPRMASFGERQHVQQALNHRVENNVKVFGVSGILLPFSENRSQPEAVCWIRVTKLLSELTGGDVHG